MVSPGSCDYSFYIRTEENKQQRDLSLSGALSPEILEHQGLLFGQKGYNKPCRTDGISGRRRINSSDFL